MIQAVALTLRAYVELGRFRPAAVQRQYQWTTREAGALLGDLRRFAAPLAPEPLADEILGLSGDAPDPAELAAADAVLSAGARDDDDDAEPDAAAAFVDADPPPPLALNPTERSWSPAKPASAYFLGPVILMRSDAAPDLYSIYDGLQRFATLMILFAALRDTWRSPHSDGLAEIDALLRADEPRDDRRLYAPTRGGALTALIGPRRASPPSVGRNFTDSDHRVLQNHALFVEQLRPWSDPTRAAFLTILLDAVTVATVSVNNRAIAYQSFVTANNRGRRLTLADIVKGEIVDLVNLRLGGAAGERASEAWRRLSGRFGDQFEDVIEAAEVLRHRPRHGGARRPAPKPGALLIQELETASADDGPAAAQAFVDWVRGDLAEIGAAYERLLTHRTMQQASGLDLALARLSMLPWGYWRPVALRLLMADIDDGARQDAIDQLARASFAFVLMRQKPSFLLNVMDDALEQLETGRLPTLRRGEAGASGRGALTLSLDFQKAAAAGLNGPLADHGARAAVVRWLESLSWGADPAPLGFMRAATVEHILPRGRVEPWRSIVGDDEHLHWVDRVGNLCLAPSWLNTRLEAQDWASKRAAYRAHANDLKLARAAAKFERWDVTAIKRRQDILVNRGARALQPRRRR